LARLPVIVAGKFQVLRRIGHGGMGVVYLGRDNRLQRLLALKTLPEVSGAAGQQMLDEAATMAAVDHPNLALVFGLEVWRSTPVLLVEHLSGGTLAERLLQGPLQAPDALRTAAALADGLASLHAKGFLHRDIKPSNIGFTRSGTPKLLDFGLARLLTHAPYDRTHALEKGDVALEATAIAGTPLYISPETLARTPPDERVDLWALSVTLFESLVGEHPFASPSLDGVRRRIRRGQADLRRWQPTAPSSLQSLMNQLLHPDPERRPATAHQLAAMLRAAAIDV
jgi:serine/threonine protein kinase